MAEEDRGAEDGGWGAAAVEGVARGEQAAHNLGAGGIGVGN
jgi:hypothetical protein